MIVMGKAFPDTPMGYRDAAAHLRRLGGIFADEAPSLEAEADRLVPLWSRVLHWIGRCARCETYSTDDGIGGRCIDCGKVHGWATRDELRSYGERATRK